MIITLGLDLHPRLARVRSQFLPSHRKVNYVDPTEASEVVLLADLLMRILDRTASRIRDRAEGSSSS